MIQSARLDDIQMMLDDEHRVAHVDQLMQDVEQLVGRRRSAGRSWARPGCRACVRSAAAQFFGKFDALRFAAG